MKPSVIVRAGALAAGAALLAACETAVSLKEPPRRAAPLPPVVVLPAETAPAPAPPIVQPLPQGVQTMPVPPVPSAATTPPPGQVVEPPLLAEQRWLMQWFANTPVTVALLPDGALRVEVPLEFSFDPGSALVKPPLAAVLDRVATSARRVNGPLRVDTPLDTEASAPRLGQDRATAIRQHLAVRGVAPTSIADAAALRPGVVGLQLSLPAQ